MAPSADAEGSKDQSSCYSCRAEEEAKHSNATVFGSVETAADTLSEELAKVAVYAKAAAKAEAS